MAVQLPNDWRSLTGANPGRIIFDLLWNTSIIALFYALYLHFSNLWTLIVLLLVSGIHWHRLAIMGHDAAHFLFFRDKKINDLISNIFCFYPLGATVAGYRSWHLDHHRTLGTEADPEHSFKRGRLYSRPFYRSYFLLAAMGDFIGMGSLELIRLLTSVGPRDKADALKMALYWALVITALTITHHLAFLGIHVLSLFTAFWVVFRVRGWSEHLDIQGTHRFHCNFFWRYIFFPHNTWCHYEHHKWPLIPYQNLPQARNLDSEIPVMSLNQLFTFFGQKPRTKELLS